MMKSKLLFLLGVVFLTSCKTNTTTITITNNLDANRSLETVELKKSDLKLVEKEDLSNYGLKDVNGELQVVQYVDKNEDGKIDVILFQPKVAANSESNYELVKVLEKEKIKVSENCYSRFVPERTDDLAWENDKVAFRVFGPTAQKMYEDGVEGGTLSSGVDCWLKRVDYPIINKWYKKNTDKTGSYHEDTGEGLDNFHVGTSRGCGGIAIKSDSTYYFSKNFISYKILTNGPIRTSFSLQYEDWDAAGKKIKESRIITLDLGSNLSKFEVTIEGSNTISAGLTLHENDGKVTMNLENNWVSYWEPHGDSELGSAIITLPQSLIDFKKYETDKKDLSNAYINLKLNNNKIIYYTGFGWKKSRQFDTMKDWNTYLNEFSKKIQSPLKVSAK